MKLSPYDFLISHRPGKTNPADAPSRRPDYKGENESINRLLPTLQQKLARVGSLSNPILAAIKAAYGDSVGYTHGQHGPNSEYPVALSSLSMDKSPLDTGPREEASAKKAMLKNLMTAAVQETHLNAVHPSRLREPQPPTRGSSSETLAQHTRNAADERLDPVAGTANCKQLVPRLVTEVLTTSETAYNASSKPIYKLIKALQQEDALVKQRKAGEVPGKRTRSAGDWTWDSQGLLRYNNKLYVPEEGSVREELLKRHHDDPMAGHFGVDKTFELMSRKYYWDSIRADVKEYIDTCDICQRVKVKRHRPYGELGTLPLPTRPWKEITMDFITDLPPSERKGRVYDSILVVVDRYTKMPRYIPTNKTINAIQLEELFMKEIILRYGAPEGIVTDRGSVFTSAFWSEVCYQLQVKRRLRTAFHPQTDEQTERQNQTLEYYLRVYCSERQDDWAELLPIAEFAYYRSEHKTIGYSLFFAMYGYQPELELAAKDSATEGGVPAAKERIKEIDAIRQELARRWQSVQEMQSKSYNKNHKPQRFDRGDLVMLSAKNLKQKRPSKKLSDKLIGPFRIQKCIETQAYRLWLPPTYRIHPVFHMSLLEPYKRRPGDPDIPEYPIPELMEDDQECPVEFIRKKRTRKGKVEYLVRWEGYPKEYDEWLSEEAMENVEKGPEGQRFQKMPKGKEPSYGESNPGCRNKKWCQKGQRKVSMPEGNGEKAMLPDATGAAAPNTHT